MKTAIGKKEKILKEKQIDNVYPSVFVSINTFEH